MLIEPLTQEEARALGTLLEKSLATPDYYPMTLNALRNACNQKSSRDPVTEYDEETLSLALAGLKRKCLVTFIPYGSQGDNYKYRHFLEDARFNLGKAELAVLAVLLLRGGQTLNEIKLRASSLHDIPSLEAAEKVLTGMAERAEPLAILLPKRPGWKEPRWRDTVRTPSEGSEDGATGSGEGAGPHGATGDAARPDSTRSDSIRTKWDEFETMKKEIADLKAAFADLKGEVDRIKTELGG